MSQVATETLRGIPEIRRFFRTQTTPVYFVSATAFNLLGMDRWVRALRYINYYDSFDGHHPRVFVPRDRPHRAFDSIEEICNHLLAHKETHDLIGDRGGKVVFLMFDDETESLAADARARRRVPARGAAAPARLEDRDDAHRRRGGCAERPQRPRPGLDLRRAARAGCDGRRWATTWSCRRRTATRARRRSSSPPRPTGTSTPSTWPARSSR